MEENNLTPTVVKGLDFRDSETQDQEIEVKLSKELDSCRSHSLREIEVKLSKGLDSCRSHSLSVHTDEDTDIINQYDKSLGLNNITVIISTSEKSEENEMILGESSNTTMPSIMNDRKSNTWRQLRMFSCQVEHEKKSMFNTRWGNEK